MLASFGRVPYRAWLALILGGAVAIAIASAATFPTNLGYDELAHRTYADVLIHDGHIPGPAESQEFHTPPAFYAVAGAAEVVAEALGAADPWRGGRGAEDAGVLRARRLTLP